MSTQVQYRRGTAAENDAFTGALAEMTIDTTNGTIRVHNGVTAGGSNIATVAYVAAQIGSLSANSISSGTSNVNIGSANANITVSVGGTSNVAVFATTGAFVTGLISATGAVTGAALTGTSLTVSTGNITGGNLLLSGAIEDSGQLDIRTTASDGNIVLTPNGTGNVNIGSNVMPTANATANIGSATLSFNTIFAQATSAQYADLAEKYTADVNYSPGTVIEFGGTNEVTITTASHSAQVAGIVSTNPSYLMNSGLADQNAIDVALVGRVPCRVVGTIAKGDRLVSSTIPGVATALDMTQYQPGCIVGKALEAYNSDSVGTIEVAVGRI
jgi:trimeric autotransporter adhesin